MGTRISDTGLDASRIMIGVLLVASGISKMGDPAAFLASIMSYQLPLAKPISGLVAVVFPWFEFFVGFLLATGVWIESGLVAAFALSTVFLTLSSQAMIRGLSIDCGCFGALVSEKLPILKSTPFAIVRSSVLWGVTGILAWRSSQPLLSNAPHTAID